MRHESSETTLEPRPGLLRQVTAIYVVCGLSYAAITGLGLHLWDLAWILIIGNPLTMLTPYLNRLFKRPRCSLILPGNYLLTIVLVTLVCLLLATGGLRSPALMWLVMLPMTGTLLIGPRHGVIWFLLAVAVAVTIGVLEFRGHQFPITMSLTAFRLLSMYALAGLAASVLACAFVYHRQVCKIIAILNEQAERDGLTGLFNHRAVMDVLDAQVRTKPDRSPVCAVIMVDVDHFKLINDRFGHLTGDRVLQEVARRIAGCVRKSDSVGRVGGEEFLCVLPECSLAVAERIAEGIREACREEAVVDQSKHVHVTVSIGVATCNLARGEVVHDSLRRADVALYEAKQSGRNQIRIADRPLPQRGTQLCEM